MKKLIILISLLGHHAIFAIPDNLESELAGFLDNQTDNALGTDEIHKLSLTRNKDIQVSYEKYYQAKKSVSVARALINPVTTGYFLGISLGVNYLWTPLIANAILSLPTKYYRIEKNKAIKNVKYWNYRHARKVFANEAVNLYLDIMSNEFILKSIELEISLYKELMNSLITAEFSNSDRITEVHKSIKGLQKEYLVISDVVIKERAALRSLLSYTPDVTLDLAPNAGFLNLINRGYSDQELEAIALKNSDKYNSYYWKYHASLKNLKMVKWSLISLNGLNFSYKQRIRIANTEKRVALSEMNSMRKKVQISATDALERVSNALLVQKAKEQKSFDSLDFNAGMRTNYENGQLSLNNYVMTAIDAIRDYRHSVVSHYRTLAMVENLEVALGKDLEIDDNGILNITDLK